VARVARNLFDFGDAGIAVVSTSSSSYGSAPAVPYGLAELRVGDASVDLSEVCTRAVDVPAQQEALAGLRKRLRHAVAGVHEQLDWAEAHLGEGFRELPSHAKSLGAGRVLLGFTGAIRPWAWRVVDVVRRRTLWEGPLDAGSMAARVLSAIADRLPVAFDAQLPLASGLGFAEIQAGMGRAIHLFDGERLVAARWPLKAHEYSDKTGLASGLLSQPDAEKNDFVLLDPRTGRVLHSLATPSRSKYPHASTSPGCDRIAFSHKGGIVDIVDGFGAAHFSIRPFAQAARGDELRVQLSHDGHWLGVDGWQVFRVVDLSRRTVAELPVPEPNMTDAPRGVLYDRAVIATGHGVAIADESGLRFVRHADLLWQPVTQPAAAAKKAAKVDASRFEPWRKPALALAPAKRSGRSWLYGAPDLPADAIPRHDGQPMSLLARIDLGEAAGVRGENPWPKQGALYFFTAVDHEGAPRLDANFHPTATRVLWHEGPFAPEAAAGTTLARRQHLNLVVHAAELPDVGAAIVVASGPDDATLATYNAWLEKQGIADQPAGHRLGGYPTILQNDDLEAQAAAIAGDDEGATAASRWRLLLQLDSDDACMWGTDSGTLYFLIHDDDLARADFSRVVALCEGL
jgi:uncharacterized protein YwqG